MVFLSFSYVSKPSFWGGTFLAIDPASQGTDMDRRDVIREGFAFLRA